MDGGHFNCHMSQTRPYHDTICKNKNMLETNFDSLSNDVAFDILFRLPAQDIYNSARLVCRKWYHMINSPNFIYSHLRSTCGLLIQNQSPYGRPISRPIFVSIKKGRVEISELIYEFQERVWSVCNGLMLDLREGDIYITNPITKRRFSLPHFYVKHAGYDSSAIAYAPTSMEYKVVRGFIHDVNIVGRRIIHDVYDSSPRDCVILTVGVDKSWRRVNVEHLSEIAKLLFVYTPLGTEGFLHWVQWFDFGYVTGMREYFLTLNVETEIITQVPVPRCDGERLGYYYLSAGRYLSLLIACTGFSWEVWEMKPETGEWTKLPDIDLEAQKGTFEELCENHISFGPVCYNTLDCSLVPVGWLKYKELLVFHVYRGLVSHRSVSTRLGIAYNLHTHEIDSIDLGSALNRFLVHTNSLVWLDG